MGKECDTSPKLGFLLFKSPCKSLVKISQTAHKWEGRESAECNGYNTGSPKKK